MNTVLPSFENIKESNEYLTPFPNIDDIFVEHQSWLKEHFLPLISIDLGMLKDEWRGQVVHMINPFEPYEGYIGSETTAYHNKFTSENWLAFRLTNDNQYEFLGDERYFVNSPKNNDDDFDDDLNEHIEESVNYYQFHKEQFEKTGKLLNAYTSDDLNDATEQEWLDNIGGGFCYGNWTVNPPIPSAFSMTVENKGFNGSADNGIDIRYQENSFYFIAGVPAYNYGCNGADWIVLMYEPISRIVLFTYDWT